MTLDQNTVLLTAGVFALGQLLTLLAAVIFYHYGSSADSRAKDALLAGRLPAPPAPTPAPKPAAPPPPATATVPTMTLTGPMSTFGGPTDTGMEPDEDLALYDANNASAISAFLLSAQDATARALAAGTIEAGQSITGLGRRLNPDKFYIACRWDYNRTPKSFLRTVGIHATNARNGKTVNCLPADWGPNSRTGRIADLSPGATAALGLKTDDTVTVTIPLPTKAATTIPENIPTAAGGEPAWLTFARGEIGQHEGPGNTGPVVQKYVDLAHCGAQGDPWCAIFANAALESAGVHGTRSALAQSFCSHPGFVRLDTPRAGAITVFWRGTRSSGQGHVGFYVGEDAGHVQVLGGNENDQVEIEPIPKNGSTMGLLGYWWPANATAEPKVT